MVKDLFRNCLFFPKRKELDWLVIGLIVVFSEFGIFKDYALGLDEADNWEVFLDCQSKQNMDNCQFLAELDYQISYVEDTDRYNNGSLSQSHESLDNLFLTKALGSGLVWVSVLVPIVLITNTFANNPYLQALSLILGGVVHYIGWDILAKANQVHVYDMQALGVDNQYFNLEAIEGIDQLQLKLPIIDSELSSEFNKNIDENNRKNLVLSKQQVRLSRLAIDQDYYLDQVVSGEFLDQQGFFMITKK